jgi:lactate dehydrogenase-like 2-hydroxyacid dehydrogenase
MRISRWGWSRYETPEDLAAEAKALEGLLEVRPPREDAEVIVVNSGTRVDLALLDNAPSARLCVTNTSGFDHLDLGCLASRGVRAARLPIARRDAVVESSLWGIIHGLRRHSELLEGAREGRWLRGEMVDLEMRRLSGSIVAVVGLGVIGARMVEVLTVLGASVVGVDPRVRLPGIAAMSLEEAAAEADVMTLHCSMEPGNRYLVDDAILASVRPGAVLVNTARGGLVHWGAARAALESGRLSAMVADVYPQEPWNQMESAKGLMLTPHSAGFHRGLSAALTHELVETVRCFLSAEALPYELGV